MLLGHCVTWLLCGLGCLESVRPWMPGVTRIPADAAAGSPCHVVEALQVLTGPSVLQGHSWHKDKNFLNPLALLAYDHTKVAASNHWHALRAGSGPRNARQGLDDSQVYGCNGGVPKPAASGQPQRQQ